MKIKCWCCKGKGWVENAYDDMYGNSITFHEDCDYCEGEGEILEEEEKRIKEESEKFTKEFLKEK